MPYTHPGTAYDHTLTPLKGWYREMALDAEIAISSNVNLNSDGSPVVAGLVVHAESVTNAVSPYGENITGPTTFVVEMGCGAGDGVPIFLYSSPADPDVSNPGVPTGVAAYGTTAYPDVYASVLPRLTGQNMVGLVATGAYEVETTEFDTDQTYAPGNGLRAVTSNTNANGGKLTNQRGATVAFNSDGATQYGDPTLSAWDTIVGFVSRGEYVNANRRPVIGLWTTFIPGTR